MRVYHSCIRCLIFLGTLALGVILVTPLAYCASQTTENQKGLSSEEDKSLRKGTPPIESEDAIDSRAVVLRGDDERLRPAEPLLQVPVGRALLIFTGAANFSANLQNNLDLQFSRKRDRFRVEPDVNLDFILAFPGGFNIFAELALEEQLTFRAGDKPDNVFGLNLNEAFADIILPLPFSHSSLRLGRQQFFEPRRWFLNDRLDAVRLFLDPYPFHVNLSASTNPGPLSGQNVTAFDDVDGDRDQLDLILDVSYDLEPLSQKSYLGHYIIYRNDDSPRDENPIWIGLRSYGKPKFKFGKSPLLSPKIRYWIDAAFVAGTIKSNDIRGFAFDVGASYIARKVLYEPYLTLAYAFGSGDSNPNDGVDGNFRQTGFQSNSGKFGGVVNFAYYGVVLDPELSNLQVFTAGLGFRPLPRTSVDLVYHHYTQDSASQTLRDFDLRADPTGEARNLGDEIDLVIGFREIRNLRLRFRSGYFFPGPAFGENNDPAFENRFDIQFSF